MDPALIQNAQQNVDHEDRGQDEKRNLPHGFLERGGSPSETSVNRVRETEGRHCAINRGLGGVE